MVRFEFNNITLRLFNTKEEATNNAKSHAIIYGDFEIYFLKEANGYFYSLSSGLFDIDGKFSKYISETEKKQIISVSTKISYLEP